MARRSAAAKAADEREELAQQLEALKGDITDLTRTVRALAKAQGRAAADEIEDGARGLLGRGEAGLAHARAQAEALGHQATDAIRAQPGAAVSLAAGMGFLLGFLSSRR